MIQHRWAGPLRNQGAPAPAPIKNFARRSSVAYFLTNFLIGPGPPSCTSTPHAQRLVPYQNDAQIQRPPTIPSEVEERKTGKDYRAKNQVSPE